MLEFFSQFPDLTAVMSEKEDGSMRIVKEENIWKQNQKNRETFFQKAGIDKCFVISAGLAHGDNVKIISNPEQKIIFKTDALVTKEKNIFLSITIADCIPIFFYEKEKGITALAHAGWKGIAGNIIENTLEKIFQSGGNVDNLYIALGPGINKCHFEIKEDILGKFLEHEESIIKKDGKIFVDLKAIIFKKLLLAGVQESNIENNSACTYCSGNLISYRRNKSKTIEAMIAVVGMK